MDTKCRNNGCNGTYVEDKSPSQPPKDSEMFKGFTDIRSSSAACTHYSVPCDSTNTNRIYFGTNTENFSPKFNLGEFIDYKCNVCGHKIVM
ncbi:MAG: hypothetical protein HY807_06620 [Nitrospirae bacterium]|nr:hypothetical protein [Nitrospirota bacterium]